MPKNGAFSLSRLLQTLATKSSIMPIETGFPFLPCIHAPSHCVSFGQILEQIKGK